MTYPMLYYFRVPWRSLASYISPGLGITVSISCGQNTVMIQPIPKGFNQWQSHGQCCSTVFVGTLFCMNLSDFFIIILFFELKWVNCITRAKKIGVRSQLKQIVQTLLNRSMQAEILNFTAQAHHLTFLYSDFFLSL